MQTHQVAKFPEGEEVFNYPKLTIKELWPHSFLNTAYPLNLQLLRINFAIKSDSFVNNKIICSFIKPLVNMRNFLIVNQLSTQPILD